MSKTSTRLDDPVLASELEAMRRMLRASEGVFSFSVAICNGVPLRDRLIDELRSSEDRLQALPVLPDTRDLLDHAKRGTTDTHPGALFLVGFQNLVRSDDEEQPVLGALNASRELWPQAFAFPVVFWVPEYAATLLSVRARDFWSWKSHEFQFGLVGEAAIARLAAEPGMLRGFDAAASLPLDRKLSRINELKSRIAEAGPAPPTELTGHVLYWLNELGVLHRSLGKSRASVADWQKALQLASNAGDRAWEVALLGNLATADAALGDHKPSVERLEQALMISREIGERSSEGNILGNLGNVYAMLGDARRAIAYHEQALRVSRDIGDRVAEGKDLDNLGTAHRLLGDAGMAMEFHQQALKISRDMGDRVGEQNSLGNLGIGYAGLGDFRRAKECYEQALRLSREIGDQESEGKTLTNLGAVCQRAGDAEHAIQFYEQALKIHREIGNRGAQGQVTWNISLALQELGRKTEAIVRGAEALQICEEIQHPTARAIRERLSEWDGEGNE